MRIATEKIIMIPETREESGVELGKTQSQFEKDLDIEVGKRWEEV